MTAWRIGETEILRIPEQLGPNAMAPDAFFPGLDRALLDQHRAWLEPTYYDRAADRLISSIHSWLIRHNGRTILLDGCAGNHKNRPFNPRFHQLNTPFLERLAAVGTTPEAVDMVLCTHLHADHVGWNTRLLDGRWVPTFPNARYLFSRTEHDHWRPTAETPGPRAEVYADSVLPVVEAGQVDLLDGAAQLDTGLFVDPAPGHTPGHVVLRLEAPRQSALFCGDVVHHPLQLYAPEMNSAFCECGPEARTTRRRVLEHCAEAGTLLFPTHFGPPHVAGVRREGAAFAPDFAAGATARSTP